jgi:hypothetical protein
MENQTVIEELVWDSLMGREASRSASKTGGLVTVLIEANTSETVFGELR